MIFISGGTGFIGSHAVRKLAAAEHKLRLLTVKGPGLATGLPPDQVEYSLGNITDPVSLKGKMDGCDVAINFVGIIIQVRDATFERIHVEGVRNLLEEAKRAGVKRFIHISALGTSETPASEYFRTKWLAEQLIKTSGIPYVILRPALVFGPEDKFFNMLKPTLYSPIVPVVGTGKTKFQPIWVEDIASCIVKSVGEEKPLNGVWEIAGPEQMTFDTVLDRMADALNMAPRIKLHVPVSLMMPVARLMEAVLPKPPLTTDQLKMLSIDNVTAANALTDVFGVQPHSFRETVTQYWRT
ncbi:MAG: complex I NDUFA9 subunit family protein [Candidatus Abyssobacteria bacterium SURF_17]|uniref:Complex I NDUFA9 subunit family protein n=1 Tax=Candidatus Abyssobacteria bacterium SURF_17 TaxID=2093361 RepID=A0A419ERV5_9BACT|nr:MAG: complex I NDUFA9 subunit family protein [Candidatus Abyssubacteria bacterium SURF_17]